VAAGLPTDRFIFENFLPTKVHSGCVSSKRCATNLVQSSFTKHHTAFSRCSGSSTQHWRRGCRHWQGAHENP
jgi:hypothetical protein